MKNKEKNNSKFYILNSSFYSDALPQISFDVRSRRWRYRDNGAFASMEAVRTQAERYFGQEKQT
ncbi:MAG: hypothetical protein F6J86_27315 [Symploca sp. SIO1B1]|nr:hypothetical protein [Symploca sp. SIO1B1]